MTTTLGLIFPRSPGRHRAGTPSATPDQIYEGTKDELTGRPWDEYMIHQPAGWGWGPANLMTNAQWYTLLEGYADAYTEALFEAQEEGKQEGRDIKVTIYGGLMWTTPFQFGGWRDRLADPRNKIHVRGMLDTMWQWALRGVTGWVFDSGALDPNRVQDWQTIMHKEFGDQFTVGLETVLWANNAVDWTWAERHGIHYHGLLRNRGGKPFLETVPEGATAYAWIRHAPFPSTAEAAALLQRGWRLAPDRAHDQLVVDAMGRVAVAG